MAFEVHDYIDLVRLLEEHPQWRAELRRLLLTDELLDLPAVVRETIEIQRRTEERIGRVEEQLALLAEAQRHTEERVSRVEEQLALLAEAQRQAAQQIADLAEANKRLTDVVAGIKGRMLELTYRENAGAYFGSVLRNVRVVKPHTLEDRLEAHLSREEFKDVLLLDLLVCGQLRDSPGTPEIWLAIEVSVVVDRADVQRAQRRAGLLRRAGLKVIPVVAGERTTEGAEEEARTQGVAMVEDGRIAFWEEAVQAWTTQ